MTFRQSFYISIAAHIMVFGSAIAFAQFSGVLLSSSHDALTIALLSSGPSSGSGEQAMPRHKVRAAAPSASAVPETVKDEAIKESFVKTDVEPGIAALQLAKYDQENDSSGNSGVAAPKASIDTGQGTSEPGGSGAPGEWSVLAAAIEKTKSYPRLARERGIEGEVRLRFRLTSSGTAEKIEILQSSGFEILDSASIGAVYRAAPLPYVSGWVEMPMKYVLK